MTVTLANYGATLVSLQVPTPSGLPAELSLGFDTVEEYQVHPFCFGSTIGRVANRISRGKFQFQGRSFQLACNENELNHIHGGNNGLDKVIWLTQAFQDYDSKGIVFSYHSPSGKEGYPGNLDIKVTYTLTHHNALKIYYFATTDQSWYVPTIFPFRVYGILALEELIWGFLTAYTAIIVYEHFLDK